MANADDLITLLVETGRDLVPDDIQRFADAAREDLRAYRDERETQRTETGQVRPTTIVRIPTRYQDQPEEFLVFECFARTFLDPVALSLAVIDHVRSVPSHGLIAVAFDRPDTPDTVDRLSFADAPEFTSALQELHDLAGTIGADVFGAAFRTNDFWGSRGDNRPG